jgi:fluoride exporter
MEIWTKVIVLSIGGTLGVNARYWLGAWISRLTSPQFPWATVIINVTGSFLVGFLTVVLTRWMPHANIRLMVITGFLGGYTTFSTFENDALTLWERGEGILMAGNLIGSVAAGFGAVLLGTAMARGLAEPAIGRAAAISHGDGTAGDQRLIPFPTGLEVPISERIDGFKRVGGHRAHADGSRR